MILPLKILKFGCSETLLLCAERATSFYICKLIVIIAPIFYLRVFAYKYSILFHVSGGIFKILGY